MRPQRSLIVTSGLEVARFLKAERYQADIVLLDLEDAVAPARKAEARRNWAQLRLPGGAHLIGLRINPLRSQEGVADLAIVLETGAQLDILVLPKVGSPADVQIVGDLLDQVQSRAQIWALLESPNAVLRASEIARAHPRLSAVSFGMADFCALTGAAMDWESTAAARATIVMAARAAGILAIDAPTFDMATEGALEADCSRSMRLGFAGKVAIHPSQVEVINRCYRHSDSTIAWARRMLDEASEGRNIAVVDGTMVGPPFLAIARNILSEAGAPASGPASP